MNHNEQAIEERPQAKSLTPALLPHQQRVVAEHSEMAERLVKLKAFIGTPTFAGLDEEERQLLVLQHGHMTKLTAVLQRRINGFLGARRYTSHKEVLARPMTRGGYNALRGWELPANENGADEGYLVEYLDGGEPNHPGFVGYISWSPKDVFERGYSESIL